MASSSSPLRGWAALGALLLLSSCTGSTGKGGASPTLDPVDPEIGMANAREALAANPADSDAWFLLARAWDAKGNIDSSLAAYDQVLTLAPAHVEAVVLRGLALERDGQADEAQAAYETAIEMAPEDPVPYVNLGSLLYFKFKKTFEAKEALARALELDPENPDAHFNMGVLFADANLYGEAMVEWEAVLKYADDGPARNLAEENLERIRPLVQSAADAESAGP